MAKPDIMSVRIPNHWHGKQEGFNFTGLLDWFPNPARYNAELQGGFSGSGLHWDNAPQLWHAAVFAVMWILVRWVSKQHIFPPIAKACGIRGRKKTQKFCYHMWLLTFYVGSSVFGYFFVLPGEPFFVFPVDNVSGVTLWNYHPVPITPKFHWYYMYQLGFYFAELYAIFVETRRSDFMEYVLHHIVTIALIGVSYLAHEHRVGAMVILIHDLPDVALCLCKAFNYAGFELTSTVLFAGFAATFAFCRLYCLPCLTHSLFCLSPHFHPSSYGFWFLGFLLGFVLQGLQVFWFAMIVRLIFTIIGKKGANSGDPRSGEDSEEDKGKGKAKGKSVRANEKESVTHLVSREIDKNKAK
jgi:hypothetical protein